MAKTFRFPVTVVVPDPDKSVKELLDKDGRLVRPASVAMRHIAPGEAVEMDEAEAKAIIARHGPFKKTVVESEGELVASTEAPTQHPRRG